ncbi:hypothetical protein [Nocardioides sp.]|nr:hypothetical protein [Nocardioides sp.]
MLATAATCVFLWLSSREEVRDVDAGAWAWIVHLCQDVVIFSVTLAVFV